jgi:RNA polymerase sigma-70 factor (ECF subfamily)
MGGNATTHSAAALYAEQRERILAMCTAMLHDRADAEDAVQETFARVTARLEKLDGDPVAYLFVVARNVCRDELRRRGRAVPADQAQRQHDDAVERTVVDRSLLRSIWTHLPAQERSLLAAVFSGWSTVEIAGTAGLSVNAAAQRISRARRRARQVVAAPAMLLLSTRASLQLRRLARLPADTLAALVGGGQQLERMAAPLLLAVIAGIVGGGAAGPAPTAPVPPAAVADSGVVPAATAPPEAAHAALLHAVARATRGVPGAPAATPAAAPPPALDGNRAVSFTASPDYEHDHTVYASTRAQSCHASCSGLFRSSDGARTWQALGGAGLLQGTVLLPPQFPRDPTLFAISPGVALLRSRDGGANFASVFPLAPAMAAIDPASPPGAARIWVLPQATPALLVWDESDGSLHPVLGLPPDVDAVTSVFTVAGSPVVYVNVAQAVHGTSLWACQSTTDCHRAGPATGGVPVTGPGAPETFFLVRPGGVEVRSVSGAGVRQIDTGPGSIVTAVLPAADFGRSRQFDVVAGAPSADAHPLLVQRFLAAGLAAAIRAWAPPRDTSLLVRLPDGHMLAALGPAASGLVCSADDGATWAPSC